MAKQPIASSITGGLAPQPKYRGNPTNIVRHGDSTSNTTTARTPKSVPQWDGDTTGATLPKLKTPC